VNCFRVAAVLAVMLMCGFSQSVAANPQFSVHEVNLEKPLEAKGPVTLDAGGGVKLQFAAAESTAGLPMRKLTVLDGENPVKQFVDEALYLSYARVDFGAAVYWVLGLFTGGAHCCGEYEFFCRPGPGQPLQYLGKTPGHNGEPQKLAQAFMTQETHLYFRDMDNRFDYFHESHAGCMLVNFPDRYHRLTPTSLTVANTAFKDRYLAQLPEVEQEIARALKTRKGKPPAILKQEHGADFDSFYFSDDLGQLLVKRAILLLYAREEARAWQELEAGVKKHYRSTRWLPELKQDIRDQLASAPY